MKKELELEEKVNLLEKEIKLLGEDSECMKHDLEEAVDNLKIEIESLKAMMNEMIPDFQNKFESVKNAVLREVEPQWTLRK